MRKGNATFLASVIYLTTLGNAPAQGPSLPPGSYQKTCTDIILGGNMLSALCKRKDGGVTRSSLPLAGCSDVLNFDGVLECIHGPAPNGSYRQTCHHIIYFPNGNLNAECQNVNGAWVGTFLPVTSCVKGADISNIDGTLSCDSGNLPRGSYLETCRNAENIDNVLQAACRTADGKWVQSGSLHLSGCSKTSGGAYVSIDNDNGVLKCK